MKKHKLTIPDDLIGVFMLGLGGCTSVNSDDLNRLEEAAKGLSGVGEVDGEEFHVFWYQQPDPDREMKFMATLIQLGLASFYPPLHTNPFSIISWLSGQNIIRLEPKSNEPS